MQFFDRPIVLVDVETTGSKAAVGRITEIACIRIEEDVVVDEFEQLINPEQFIPYSIQRMTGISNELVADKPAFSEVTKRVFAITDGALFVAHNVWFDYNFIQKSFARSGISWRPDTLCTVQLARRLFPQARSHSLSSIIDRHSIDCAARHRAYGDTKVLVNYLRMAEEKFDHNYLQDIVDDLITQT
jgi:DNA polymerase-3 subunit epsilon